MSITTSDDLPAKPVAESVRNLPDGGPAADSVKKRRRPPATDGNSARRSLPSLWTMALVLLLLLPGGCSAPAAVDTGSQEVSQVTTATDPETPATDSAAALMTASPTPVVPTATPTEVPTATPTEVAEVGAGEAGEAVTPEVVLPPSPVPPAGPSQQPDVPLEAPTIVPPVPYKSPEITNKWEAFPTRKMEQVYILQYEGTGLETGISFPIEIGVNLRDTPWGMDRWSFKFTELLTERYGRSYLEVAHYKYNQQHPDDKISYEEYLDLVRAGEGQYFYNYYIKLPNGKFEVAEGRATIDPRDGVAVGFVAVDDRIGVPDKQGPGRDILAKDWPRVLSYDIPIQWADFQWNRFNQPMIVVAYGIEGDSFDLRIKSILNKPEERDKLLEEYLRNYLIGSLNRLAFSFHLGQNNRGYLERTYGEGGGAKKMDDYGYPSSLMYLNALAIYYERPDLVIDDPLPRSIEQFKHSFNAIANFYTNWENVASPEEIREFQKLFVEVVVNN